MIDAESVILLNMTYIFCYSSHSGIMGRKQRFYDAQFMMLKYKAINRITNLK